MMGAPDPEPQRVLDMVVRALWRAEEARKIKFKVEHPVRLVWWAGTHKSVPACHDNDTCRQRVRQVQALTTRKFADIEFSFVVGGDGEIYEGRGWYTIPKLPSNYMKFNKTSLYIGFIGQFTRDTLPQNMADAAQRIIDFGIENKHINERYILNDMLSPTLV